MFSQQRVGEKTNSTKTKDCFPTLQLNKVEKEGPKENTSLAPLHLDGLCGGVVLRAPFGEAAKAVGRRRPISFGSHKVRMRSSVFCKR